MARIEITSGTERRRRWSDEAKLRILAEAALSARSRWSTEIKDLNWCDVVVESLQGSQATQTTSMELLGNAANPPALVDVLHSRFQNFLPWRIMSIGRREWANGF
jgi:hypothetical protein